MFELLILIVNYIVAFSICYWANYTQGKRKLSRKSENAVADDRVLKFLYDVDLRHVKFLSAMSPEIQEWSHKSRSGINNLYLLTRPITKAFVNFLTDVIMTSHVEQFQGLVKGS